ncbi:MAG: hypothetical protein ACE5J5_04205 [Candidatus Hydrothermarchaeales archaeon]
MSEGFLSPDELLKKLISFKEKWFAVAEKSEALSNYKSGFDADFEKALSDIYQRIDSCRKDIEFFSLSVEHHIPKSRRRIKKLVVSIINELDNFKGTLQQDIETLKDYDSLKPRLTRLERELTEADKRYQMVSELAEGAYNEYIDTKKTHEEEVQNIKNATDKTLAQIRDKFVFDFDEMFKGYDLATKADGGKIDPHSLFTSLTADGDFAEKIEIVPKGLSGLIGGKESELDVRKALLKYKAKEINKELRPVLEKEKKKLKKFESEILHIEELKNKAQGLDVEKEEIGQEKEGVKRKIDKLSSKGEEVMRKFLDYEDILDLREDYLKDFNDINIERRKLFKLIEGAIKTYEPPEPDLEKRELKEEISALTKEIKKHEKKNLKLNGEKESITKKYTSTRSILAKKSKEIGRLRASIKEQESRIKGLDDEVVKIAAKLEGASKRLSLTQKKLEGVEEKIAGYKLDIKTEKKGKARLEIENLKIKGELQERIQKLEKSTEEYKKLEKEVKKSRKRIKEQKTAHASLETKYKMKVREVKRLNLTIKRLLKEGKRTKQTVDEEREEEERIVTEKIEALRNGREND